MKKEFIIFDIAVLLVVLYVLGSSLENDACGNTNKTFTDISSSFRQVLFLNGGSCTSR